MCLGNGLLKGVYCQVQLRGAVPVVGGDLITALVLYALGVKLQALGLLKVGVGQIHDIHGL